MPIDLKKLDDQIQKLQGIRKIASDPESLALLEQFILDGRIGGGREAPKPATHLSVLDELSDAGKGGTAPQQRGEQIGTIRRIVASGPENFDVSDVGEKIRASGIKISNVAVGKVLKRLEKRGEIKIVQRGKPNIYRRA